LARCSRQAKLCGDEAQHPPADGHHVDVELDLVEALAGGCVQPADPLDDDVRALGQPAARAG
jgi:hypothetical protein